MFATRATSVAVSTQNETRLLFATCVGSSVTFVAGSTRDLA
jgi:hypothetical protein